MPRWENLLVEYLDRGYNVVFQYVPRSLVLDVRVDVLRDRESIELPRLEITMQSIVEATFSDNSDDGIRLILDRHIQKWEDEQREQARQIDCDI